MDPFKKLKDVALRQNQSGEFPLWLLAEVLAIAGDPGRYVEKVHLIELLITQIDDFDPYAGVGCFDTSISADTVRKTILRITA